MVDSVEEEVRGEGEAVVGEQVVDVEEESVEDVLEDLGDTTRVSFSRGTLGCHRDSQSRGSCQ